METRLKIIITAMAIFLGLTGLVIYWPKLTKKKAPPLVEKLRAEFKGTKIGRDLLNVLGDKIDSNDSERPLDNLVDNGQQVIKKSSNTVVEKVREEVIKVIVEKSSDKIVEKLNKLPEIEKEEVKKNFCK